MPSLEAISPTPIKMCFFEPPVDDEESQRIYRTGVATVREGIIIDGIPQSPKEEKITVDTAKEHSFAFLEAWGRRAGTLTAIACLSNWLAGFDGTDAKTQRDCGLDILRRITGPDVEPVNYGNHKSVVFIRTKQEAQVMVSSILDAQDQSIRTFFPRYAKAQEDLTGIRRGYLIDSDGKGHFGNIFDGNVSALTRPIGDGKNPEDNYFYKWGYEIEEGEQYAISPGFTKYSLSMLIASSPVEETAHMLTDIQNFLKEESDENRFVIQIDWDEDATCSNTAINAQQSVTESISSAFVTFSLNTKGSEFAVTSLTHTSGGGYISERTSEYCKIHKNEKKDECSCNNKFVLK